MMQIAHALHAGFLFLGIFLSIAALPNGQKVFILVLASRLFAYYSNSYYGSFGELMIECDCGPIFDCS